MLGKNIRRCEWKHLSGSWRPNMKSASVQVSGSRGLGKSKHYPWSLGREWRPIWHHIKQIMLYFQWKILFWLLPTVWWMIMFIIVSYLLGWPHKKLTMSLIDLFPSANDVSTEPQCRQGPQWPPRYHWQLLFASDDHFNNLLWARRISSDNSAAKYLLLRGSDWLIIIWSRTPVFVTRSWTLNNGHRKKGQWIEDCQHRKQVNICTCADIYLKHNIMSS